MLSDSSFDSVFKIRASLDEAIQSYVLDHYPNGVSAVYGSQGKLTIAIVDTKYNPGNYWYDQTCLNSSNLNIIDCSCTSFDFVELYCLSGFTETCFNVSGEGDGVRYG